MVVNFVPDVFDMDSNDFYENRFKYCNDPTIMKKLLEDVRLTTELGSIWFLVAEGLLETMA